MNAPQSERNIEILLEYDGTAYSGWQLQENADSIQARVLDALENMISERPALVVAGRTDAGVHAAAQIATFKTSNSIEPRRFAPGLNRHLPDDITVHRTREVPLDFNPRRDSKSKRYRYRVYCGPQAASLELNRAWQIRAHLNAQAMRDAASLLIGHKDFNAFRSVRCDADHAQRDFYNIEIEERPRPPLGTVYLITFHANAYCRHMCRIIAGTLVEVGWGKRTRESVQDALERGDRRLTGRTAPACGLTLLEVLFE